MSRRRLPAGIEPVDLAPAPAPASRTRRAAYHDGPPDIHFAGRPWRRGVPQPVTDAEWRAINARGDVGEFAFRLED